MVSLDSGSQQEMANIMLTRYLIAQNSDPRKEESAPKATRHRWEKCNNSNPSEIVEEKTE